MSSIPKIFIAYARKDEALLNELRTHLAPLKRSGRATIWYDGKIEPGVVWEQAIKKHLHSADIILMLVSASAIASDYFYDQEMKDALQRHHEGTARLVPLILRPCAWNATPLAELQALPKDAKAVTSWPDRDAAYSDAVRSLWDMIHQLEEEQKKAAAAKAEALLQQQTAEQRQLEEQQPKEEAARRPEQQVAEAKRQQKMAEEKKRQAQAAKAQRALRRKEQTNQLATIAKRPYVWGTALLLLAAFGVFKLFSGGGQPGDKVNQQEAVAIVNQDSITLQELIQTAQTSYNDQNYTTSKQEFQKALNFAEANNLNTAKAKIGVTASEKALQVIIDEQSKQEKENNYKNWKEKGDKAYRKGNYDSAKDFYETAASYQNDKTLQPLIKKCEDKIAEKKKPKPEKKVTPPPIDSGEKKQSTIIAQLDRNMVTIPSGSFTMGCTSEQGSDCADDEKPTRQVQIKGFKMGKYEVTQAEWRAVMGSDPSELYFKGCDQCPVERVSWDDIQDFIKKLNQKTGKRYRLPSEAEWEYAARGGQNYKYAGSNDIGTVAWYDENSNKKTHPVGTKKGNGYGLYDMSGNVWEWCQDKWHDSYKDAPPDSRAWESGSSSGRVLRGGGWYAYARGCRVSNRNRSSPDLHFNFLGFRLALSQ